MYSSVCSLVARLLTFLFLFAGELDGWFVMAVWFESVVNCLACVDWPIVGLSVSSLVSLVVWFGQGLLGASRSISVYWG